MGFWLVRLGGFFIRNQGLRTSRPKDAQISQDRIYFYYCFNHESWSQIVSDSISPHQSWFYDLSAIQLSQCQITWSRIKSSGYRILRVAQMIHYVFVNLTIIIWMFQHPNLPHRERHSKECQTILRTDVNNFKFSNLDWHSEWIHGLIRVIFIIDAVNCDSSMWGELIQIFYWSRLVPTEWLVNRLPFTISESLV